MKKGIFMLVFLCSLVSLSTLPATGFAASAKSSAQAVEQLAEKVDINMADADLLATVPGIGQKTADAIIQYRNDNGKFASVDDLLNIKGIGEKKLEKMKPYLKTI